MTTAKMKREAMQTSPFRYEQAECNPLRPAYWFDLKLLNTRRGRSRFLVFEILSILSG